jgi:hypothetical protein
MDEEIFRCSEAILAATGTFEMESVSLLVLFLFLCARLGSEQSSPLLLQRSHLAGHTLSLGKHYGVDERFFYKDTYKRPPSACAADTDRSGSCSTDLCRELSVWGAYLHRHVV